MKLGSWTLISHKNKYGFLFGILGNLVLGIVSYNAGLYGIAVYCVALTIIQLRGWFKWEKK